MCLAPFGPHFFVLAGKIERFFVGIGFSAAFLSVSCKPIAMFLGLDRKHLKLLQVSPLRKERRQHFRTKIAIEVDLQSERTATPFRVKTTDLSIGRLYVEMMFTLEVGNKLKLGLWLNDVQVSTGGIVVTRDLQVGNGIKFIDMATEDRLRLKRFLAVAGNPLSPDITNQNQRQEES